MTTYFFDSYLPRRLAEMLRSLDVPIIHQLDPAFHDASDRATADSAWVRAVREHGYTLVTIDRVNRKDTFIPLALELRDLTIVFLPTGFEKLDKWEQAKWLLKHWPKLEAHSRAAEPGMWVRISLSGDVKIIEGV